MAKHKIAPICIAALLVGLFSGCGFFEKEVMVTPNPVPVQTQKAETEVTVNTPDVITQPTPYASEYAEEKNYTLEIEGYQESVTMQLLEMSFWETDGPELGIYIDNSIYETSYYDGSYTIVPLNCGEVSTFMQISYYPDVTAIGLVPTIFFSYESDLYVEALGEYAIENGYAQVVEGEGYDGSYWLAYIMDIEGGAITIVIRLAPEAIEGHGPRLLVSAESIFVK